MSIAEDLYQLKTSLKEQSKVAGSCLLRSQGWKVGRIQNRRWPRTARPEAFAKTNRNFPIAHVTC